MFAILYGMKIKIVSVVFHKYESEKCPHAEDKSDKLSCFIILMNNIKQKFVEIVSTNLVNYFGKI